MNRFLTSILFSFLFFNAIAQETFKMVIASDPQPFYSKVQNDQSLNFTGSHAVVTKVEAREYYKITLPKLVKNIKDIEGLTGIMINGDLVNSNGGDNRLFYTDKVFDELKKGGLEYYAGLGNHDVYKNDGLGFVDVHSTWSLEHIRYVKGVIKSKYGENYYDHSIHYAFVKENYMFIQVNISPFTKYTTNNLFPKKIPAALTTNLDTDWLNEMNKIARSKGYKIILNFHAYDDGFGWVQDTFYNFLRYSEVVAIFVGHIHETLGKKYPQPYLINNYIADIPVIYSGAMHLGTYLLVTFEPENINVKPVVMDISPYRLNSTVYSARERAEFDIAPNPKPATASFTNNSLGAFGYLAKVTIKYTLGNKSVSEDHEIERTKTVTVQVPNNATDVTYEFEYLDFTEWKSLNVLPIVMPITLVDLCFQITGSISRPFIRKCE